MSISPRQFEQMKNRVSGARRKPTGVFESAHLPSPTAAHQVILGIDPSLRGTGYGVLQLERDQARVLAQGTIRAPAGWERSRCLVQITHALRDIIRRLRPAVCVVEGLFYAQNIQTALIMGEARGASLVAAAEARWPWRRWSSAGWPWPKRLRPTLRTRWLWRWPTHRRADGSPWRRPKRFSV